MFWQSEPFTEQITTMDYYKLNRLSMTGIENWTTGWTASIPLSGQKKPSQRFFWWRWETNYYTEMTIHCAEMFFINFNGLN